MFLGCQVCRGNLKGEISVANVAHCREIRKSPLEFLEGEIEILCNAIVERWRTVGAQRGSRESSQPNSGMEHGCRQKAHKKLHLLSGAMGIARKKGGAN